MMLRWDRLLGWRKPALKVAGTNLPKNASARSTLQARSRCLSQRSREDFLSAQPPWSHQSLARRRLLVNKPNLPERAGAGGVTAATESHPRGRGSGSSTKCTDASRSPCQVTGPIRRQRSVSFEDAGSSPAHDGAARAHLGVQEDPDETPSQGSTIPKALSPTVELPSSLDPPSSRFYNRLTSL